jgi:hypothetical protein
MDLSGADLDSTRLIGLKGADAITGFDSARNLDKAIRE